ncbi:MAG: hypothetical protein EZS28_023510 [Streblomastix strix]|uniref:Tyr recombinase domain-containing protein n=1 Tax=Streblomastix strix TaxID=222440 RepID=A0A5J4VEY0_9EUKA|nr:MAG: hypothetical protein EZS28_023510 [Streblomastix strix]
MLIHFFRRNKISEIRLKFSIVDKTENQASLILAQNQANTIESYEVYEIDNEKLSPKLAIYEWIDRLEKQYPKGTDFLLWHKGFNKPTTTKDICLQHTKQLEELKIVGASAYSIRHSATTELAKQANEIARQLTNNPGQDNEGLNQVSQQRVLPNSLYRDSDVGCLFEHRPY